MKIIVFMLLIILATFILSSCYILGIPDNTIMPKDFSMKEWELTYPLNDYTYIYSFNLVGFDIPIKLEKYINGTKESESSKLLEPSENPGDIVITINDIPDDKSGSKRLIRIVPNSESGTGPILYMDFTTPPYHSSLVEQCAEMLPVKENMVLLSMLYSEKESITGLSKEFYKDPDAHMDELAQYQEAYLLRFFKKRKE